MDKENIMSTNRDKLALRRQSIRTLTDSELRFAHGGNGNAAGTISTAPSASSGTSVISAAPTGTARQSSGTSVIAPSGGLPTAHPSGGLPAAHR
jgi:hypothetical protein